MSTFAQEGTAPAAQEQPAPAAPQPPVADSQPAQPQPSDKNIKFNFRGATYQQVVEFFSRVTGLPVIWQTPPPEGTLDYISPESYDQPEALRVLNMVLQSKGVMLRVSRDNLYLQKLDAMQREDIPTFISEIPKDITDDQIISVVRPLKISLAKPLAEKLGALVASYGAVTAMDQQNTVVITETAANARRILAIIEQLDLEDPDGAVEIFSIKNAKAAEILIPLKALMSQRVEKFVINQQGQQVKIEEDQMPGLSISADERTNTIIAKGTQSKIDKLRETISLLDIPDSPGMNQGRSMTTISLSRLAPAEAVQKLNQLYQRIPEKERPTVLAMEDAAKVMIVGDDGAITEGTLLVGELENGPVTRNGDEPTMTVIPLRRAAPGNVITAITSLLNRRQQTATKLIAGTDGKSIIVSGLTSDVDAIKSLVPTLDRASTTDRQVRVMKLNAGDPKAIVDQARQVFTVANPDVKVLDLKAAAATVAANASTDDSPDDLQMIVNLDADARMVTLVGSARTVDLFTAALRQFEANVVVDRESRRFPLANAMPSELAGPLQAMAPQVLLPKDGSQYIAPTFAAVDQLNVLMVTATPEQLETLTPLVESMDAASAVAARPEPVLMQLRVAEAWNLANIIMAQYNQRSAAERKAKPVFVGADPQTNALIVSAHPDVLPAIKAMVDELNRIERVDNETREVHIYPLKAARAEQLARTMEEIFPQPPVPLDVRGRPQPQLQKPRPVIVRAEPQTNSLIISALPGTMSMTQEMIAQLDVDPIQLSGGGAQSIHVLTIQNADAAQLSQNLDAIFNAPGQSGSPLAKPTIRVDAASNSLLVRANDEQMKVIQEVVAKIDKATIASSRQMRMIAIDPSKASADDVAAALKRMLDQSGSGGTVQVLTLEELIQQREKKESTEENVPAGSSSQLNLYDTAARFALFNQTDAPARSVITPASLALRPGLPFILMSVIIGQTASEQPTEPDVTIAVDPASNSLIILGSSRAVERVSGLVRQIQDQIPAAPGTIRYVTLPSSIDVNQLSNLLLQTMDKITPRGGQMGDLRKRTAVIADPAGNALIIAANDTDFAATADLIAVLSKPPVTKFPIRTVTLRRADAGAVAQAITQFYDERAKLASTAGGRQAQRKVAIAGIETTNTLLISASDEEFAQVESLIEQFDTGEAAAGITFRVFQLQHAKATEIERTVQNLVNDLIWNQPDRFMFFWPPQPQSKTKDTIAVTADPRLNALIVTGRGDKFDMVEQMIDMLDAAPSEGEQRIVKFYRMDRVPLTTVAEVVRESFNQGRQRRPWEPPDPNEVKVRTDPITRSIIVTATAKEQDDVKVMIDAIAAQLAPQTPAATGAAGANPSAQSIFIIDLNNISPETAKTIVETIGLDKPQPADSIARVVSEPIKISLIPGRNGILVLANPSDRDTVVGLLKAIDSEPMHAEAHTRIFRLKTAQAAALSNMLSQVLNPGEQQVATPLARAVREQVRRLAVRGPGANAQTPATVLDLSKPIRIVPDANLNALIVSSTADNITAMEGLIAMFDQLPISDAVTVQIFPLQNIAAEQFARIIREMFAQGKQLGRTALTRVQGIPEGAVGQALLNDIAMTTDERTNSVIVAGSEDAVALVEVLSKRIDSDVIVGWVEPKVLALRYADATEIATTLQAILVDGAGSLPQSSPIQRQIGRLRMAKLHPNGDPQNVIESDVFTPMTRLVIRAEPKSNTLILIGTPANIELVGELVAMLDIESSSPAGAVRIYPIVNASAARMATTIRQLFDQQVQSKAIRPEDRVVVQADERTNSLVVTTTPRSFAVLEGLLKTLDAKLSPDLREIRMVEVKNASAARLATMIQQLMDARLERLRRVQPETADLERAVVVADTRSNSLIVAAGNDAFEVITRLAADLDKDTLGDSALVHVLPMPAGGAGNIDRIAAAVNQIMERRYADLPQDIRRAQRPLVLTDNRTNSLLVSANPEDLASIQDLVEKLSAAPTNPAVGLHLIAVPSSTRAETLAPRIQRLMSERQQSMGATATPSDRVSIEAELASNSLIVAANDENLEIIRGLLDVLVQADATGGSGRAVEVVTLSPANRAADIVDMLRDLYVQEANRTRGQNTVRVTADERLNAVVINAPEGDVRAIKGLIAQLEGAKPANVVEIKYIVLKSANALETVSLIENVLSGRSLGARRGSRQATVLKYLRAIDQGVVEPTDPSIEQAAPVDPTDVEMEVSAAIRESISLTPDLRTNTIIVSAPRESITMIERMIRDLDESSTGAKSIRIFKLTNADAIAMAELLTELFQLRQGSNLYVLKPREEQPSIAASPMIPAPAGPDGMASAPASGLDGGFGGLGGTELTAVPDERQQLSITVDSRTNSLIVSGTPTYLDLVSKVVEELDTLEANEREVFVYQLRNSVAADVAKVLGDFVAQEQRKLVSTLSADQLGSAARLLEREITIQGDKQSNTVLVSASPRYMDRVKEMIKKLDVDPPQVLIQVMLAEVTLDSKDEWGVNLEAMATIGSTTVSGGYGLATAFVPGIGVPNLAIASSDFDLLIRAMKSQGRLQVLSNPSIMAANNAPARIQVGETIRLPVSTSFTDNGTSFSALEKEDLGVILEVTPSINPDGFVRMTINPEISNLSQRTTQISEDFQSPIITRRTADTTVTVQDGQTIVIGGLISDRFERRDRKVPFFGDLPLVGALFRSNTEETAKTELLIVLTPHVIDSPAEFGRIDHITEKEIDRLSVPAAVKESIRRSLLDGTGGLYNASGERIDVKMNDEVEDD